jgi:hypothetical protein
MLYKRLVLSLLLIAVPLLGLTPQVSSQNFTTITSLNTLTTDVTITEMNLSTAGKVTATMNREATLFATQVILSGVGGAQGGCNVGFFGLYYLVFTTGSYSDAIIVANLGTPIHVVTSYLQYVTLSNFRTGGVTETITSISLSQLGQPSQIPTGLIEFVLVILAGMITIGLWKRRRT